LLIGALLCDASLSASENPFALKRLTTAPNLALATLWADMLSHAGTRTRVERAYASGIAGEIPPDQALPELWLEDDDADLDAAKRLLDALRNAPSRRWACPGCGEVIDGPFEQCWNCGAAMPA
jgi:uncharacterized protein YlaI